VLNEQLVLSTSAVFGFVQVFVILFKKKILDVCGVAGGSHVGVLLRRTDWLLLCCCYSGATWRVVVTEPHTVMPCIHGVHVYCTRFLQKPTPDGPVN